MLLQIILILLVLTYGHATFSQLYYPLLFFVSSISVGNCFVFGKIAGWSVIR